MSNLVEIQNELQSKRKELQHELNRIDAAISALSGVSGHSLKLASITSASTTRRVLSLGARRRIAAAQRARWAKVRAQKKGSPATAVATPRPRRVMSMSARRRIAAAQRARWAKVRAQKKAA
jgi:hypothetical protein